MSLWRNRLITPGRAIAWLISLALGIGWAALLASLPEGYSPVAVLFLELGGIFGFVFGLLIALGMLVRFLSLFGARPGAMSRPSGELGTDMGFGVCLMLMSLPSLGYLLYGG